MTARRTARDGDALGIELIFRGVSAEKTDRVFAIVQIVRPRAGTEPVVDAHGHVTRRRQGRADFLRAVLGFHTARPTATVDPHDSPEKCSLGRRSWQIEIEFLRAVRREVAHIGDHTRSAGSITRTCQSQECTGGEDRENDSEHSGKAGKRKRRAHGKATGERSRDNRR